DAGYSNGEQFQACDDVGITAYVPANRGTNNKGDDMPLFDRSAFPYDAATDQYQCPTGRQLPLKQVNGLQRIYAVRGDCTACPLKPRCTKAKRRHVTRHVHEAAFERMLHRMQAHPEMM